MHDDLTALPLDALSVEQGNRPKAPDIPGATDQDRAKGANWRRSIDIT